MADKFLTQCAGFYLDVFTVTRNNPNSIIKNEYPFSRRNKLKSHGAATESYAVQCVFSKNLTISKGWDSSIAIFPTFEAHKDFLEIIAIALEKYSFTHPDYGEMEGFVQDTTIVKDDTQGTVAISFNFLREIDTDDITFVQYVVQEQADGFRGSSTRVGNLLAAAQKGAQTLSGFAGQAAQYKGKLDAYELLKSINSAVDRIVESFITIQNTPASFVNNCILGVRELASLFTGLEAELVFIAGSSRVAYEAAVVYTQDDVNQQKVAKLEGIETFDAAGNFIGTTETVFVMTAQELEVTLFNTRELMNEAILSDRELQDLKNQANSLQKYINTIKLSRDNLETQEVPNLPLHLVALNNEQSYQTVDRVLSLNPQIKNPTFAEGNIQIIVPRAV